MSRWWPEAARLLVEPDAFDIAAGGAPRRVEFAGRPQDALPLLSQEGDAAIRPGTRWQVLLADGLVRYLVVEWPAGLRGRPERAAFVAHRFREVHGIESPEWQFAIEPSVTGVPTIACAAPVELIAAVDEWAARNRLRVARITGEFVATYNRLRSRLDNPLGALAIERGGRLTVGLWHDAMWLSVRSQPLGAGGANALGQLLQSLQTRAASQAEGGTLYRAGTDLEAPAGWAAIALGGEAWA
ncbi:hypothetical protein [Azoarcus sp. KH32C]|uniref:hypothetical protein n=1 Tax=Azoarcus sp. KH32C TaxID=748247 RepID=UPI0002386FBE|nr:hypothetical protein [Azoarcus sp. KH32C]BAL23427.1 hypothetical protein AZKH_1097 [Azoarcus sp. KH32C]